MGGILMLYNIYESLEQFEEAQNYDFTTQKAINEASEIDWDAYYQTTTRSANPLQRATDNKYISLPFQHQTQDYLQEEVDNGGEWFPSDNSQ